MDETLRRRLHFLAGKPDDELTPRENTELFRLFAAWEASEAAREDQRILDCATLMIDPSHPTE